MGWEESLLLLRDSGIQELIGDVTHAKTMTSAVTTAWGVAWNETYIARDLMQNFYDANRDHLTQITINVVGTQATVSAPAEFKLERLFYLGSEKGEEDIGQYGEGFKVAATCLLRDHQVRPVVLSGHDVVCLRIARTAISDTNLYPVEYDFFTTANYSPGTKLVLPGCSPQLTAALRAGLTHFLYAENPLLGEKVWSSWQDHFSMYRSTNEQGHVFYQKLKRGEMPDLPLVLVINKKYDQIERKIAHDRDRNFFGEALMEQFYRTFAQYGVKHDMTGQRAIVEVARHRWVSGHPLLAAIADASPSYRFQLSGTSWPEAATKAVFGEGFFAQSTAHDPAEQLEYSRFEQMWQAEGRQRVPGYFAHFGVLNARQHTQNLRVKAIDDDRRANVRALSQGERVCIDLLAHVLRDLVPTVAGHFTKATTTYKVVRSEIVLGQLRKGQGYRSTEIYLEESVFLSDFPRALAVFLHEHTHIFGYDGSRGFTDALTELLEVVVRYRQNLDRYDTRWRTASAAVGRERKKAPVPTSDGGIDAILDQKTSEQLRELLQKLPRFELERLLHPGASIPK